MELLVFDGRYDAYFWVLCVDKFCKVRGISEKEKMVLAATAMSGSALKWWNWWSPRHPGVNWNMFTISLLWHFKPEDRCILPIVDDEEEPDQEVYPLVELSGKSHESSNDILEAWDEFLTSTEQINVPMKNFMVETVTPTSEFKGGIVDLPEPTQKQGNETPKGVDNRKIVVESHFEDPNHVLPLTNLVSVDASLTTEKMVVQEDVMSVCDPNISLNSTSVPKPPEVSHVEDEYHVFLHPTEQIPPWVLLIVSTLPPPEPPDKLTFPTMFLVTTFNRKRTHSEIALIIEVFSFLATTRGT
jgi:hypothetical protein